MQSQCFQVTAENIVLVNHLVLIAGVNTLGKDGTRLNRSLLFFNGNRCPTHLFAISPFTLCLVRSEDTMFPIGGRFVLRAIWS